MVTYQFARAGVAEMADAHGSGPCGLTPVGVQVPSPAPSGGTEAPFLKAHVARYASPCETALLSPFPLLAFCFLLIAGFPEYCLVFELMRYYFPAYD